MSFMKELWKKAPIGKYSGNKRIDPSTLQEPDLDNDYSKKMWLEEMLQDPDYQQEVKQQLEKFKETVRMTANPDKLRIHMVGESHIDVCWLWRYEQTRQKGLLTFKKACQHAKMFPGKFTFAASEPVLMQWILEDDPKTFEEIKDAVKSGQFELVGGSWVEPDCMMPTGEAFIRQRLYGMRFDQQHFGRVPDTEWFLDSFGYNFGLPQILAKSGVKNFWTSKITWNRQTVFPFVNFWWESPDGSKILTSNFQMGWGPMNTWMQYEIGRHPLKSGAQRKWCYKDEYENIGDHVDDNPENIIPPVGCFFGAGDGGRGPTHQEVAFAQVAASTGWAKWSRVENFFKDLEPYGDVLPIWNDELYLEYHRGTFTVHFEVKRHNRFFERKLMAVESLASLLSISSGSYQYPVDKLEKIWKIVLLNQFHDALPGSSIPEVYDDLSVLWQECASGINEMLANWSQMLSVPKGTQITLSNPLAWERKSPVFIPLSACAETMKLDTNGKPPYIQLACVGNINEILIGQPVAAEQGDKDDTRPAGWWVVPTLAGMATKCYKILSFSGVPPSKSQINVSPSFISNGVVKIEIDPKTGAISKLTAQNINESKNLIQGNMTNLTVGYLDDFKSDHAWNIKPEYWKYPLVIANDTDVQITVKESGPVFATIEISRTLGEGLIKDALKENETIGASKVWQKITLFNELPGIYLTYEADWKQPYVMLKVVYDTTTDAVTTVSDQQYCAIERATHAIDPTKVDRSKGLVSRCDWARYEKIMHTYCDVSTPDKKWGLAMLNEGKYAYDAQKGMLRLTMLRTPVYPNPAAEAFVHKERKERKERDGSEVPKFVDLGFLRCRYALLPHMGGALESADGSPNPLVKRAAEEFNIPIIVQKISNAPEGKSSFVDGSSLISCEPQNVLVTTIKQKEWEPSKNLILRVFECTGHETQNFTVKIHPSICSRIKLVVATDLIERPTTAKFSWDTNTGILSGSIGKFEILSFELQM